MATLNLGRVRGDKGADSTVPGPRGIPGPQGPQGPAGTPGPKGEDATPVNLGSAATKDVGTGAEQIPQNKNLGSAAFKNAGEAYGNVIEVGAFGLGGHQNTTRQENEPTAQALIDKLLLKGSGFFRNVLPTSLSSHYAAGIFGNTSDTFVGITASYNTDDVRVFSGISANTANPRIVSLKHDKNTTQDANGFLRDISSTKQTVVADPTGNVAVPSIQAGAGAPKVKHAFFNSTNVAGPGSIASVALGIPYNKILAISCLLGKTTTKYPPNHSDFADKALYYVKLVRVASDMAAVQFILATGDQSSSLYYATTQIFVTYTE